MKKIVALIISVLLVFGLVACGNSSESDDNKPSNTSEAKPSDVPESGDKEPDTDETEKETETTSDKKTLVVYYSATGTTKKAASYIADALGADLFELEPKELYSDKDLDYTDKDSRVYNEYENEDKRDVELVNAKPDNWESYDTVLIGYPIWWGIAAWPINEFVQTNDFNGKTVIPFCTSASSGLGDSGELLEKMAGSGKWLEGKRFSGRDSEDTIKDWAKSLGL